MPKKYYKIQEGIVNEKKYFGLFVSTKEEFACDINTFVRGWELERYSQLPESERNDFASGLKHDVAGKNFSQV